MKDPHDIQKEFQSVLGYYELGMWDEALAEVDEIEAGGEHAHLELNELRLVVYQGAKRWEEMRRLAQTSAEREPTRASWFISWAFALRREDSIPAARRVLERAQALHPGEALIPFNLACYASQEGRFGDARGLLSRALRLDPELEKNAREDDDLEPLRRENGFVVPPLEPPASVLPEVAPFLAVPVPPPVPPQAPAPVPSPAPYPPSPVPSVPAVLSRASAVPPVPAALRVYARNLIEGDSEARAVALHALVTAKAEGVLATLLASGDPAVVRLAGEGLRECWRNAAGAGARKRLEKGIAAMERGAYDDAEEAFRSLMADHPRWAEATHQMATLHYLRKRSLESMALCRRVVELKPDHFDAWQGIALCAIQLGYWPVALDAARQCLRLQPRHRPHQDMVRSLEIKVKS